MTYIDDSGQVRYGLSPEAQAEQDAFTARLRNPETQAEADQQVEDDVQALKNKLKEKRDSLTTD